MVVQAAFILIIIAAAVLRLWQLGQFPPGLYLDEVLYGLDAYSIINTGKDIYGHFLPLAFQSSGYYPPLFTYILAPFFLLLPLVAGVVRLPNSLAGIITVILSFFVTKKLLGREYRLVPWLVMIGLAFSWWHIHLSRVAFLGAFGLVFLLAGVWFNLIHKPVLGHALLVLSTFSHYGYKLLVPALALVLLRRPRLLFVALIWLVGLAVNVYSIRTANALARSQELGLHLNPAAYLEAFSPQFLFIKGDHYGLINPWQTGQLPWALLPLILIGIWVSRNLPHSAKALIWIWLLITPIPAALSGLGAHAVRVSPVLIPLMISAGIGAETLWRHHHRFLCISLCALWLVQTLSAGQYFTVGFWSRWQNLWGPPPRQSVYLDYYNSNLAWVAFQERADPRQIQTALLRPIKFNDQPAKQLDSIIFISGEQIQNVQ